MPNAQCPMLNADNAASQLSFALSEGFEDLAYEALSIGHRAL